MSAVTYCTLTLLPIFPNQAASRLVIVSANCALDGCSAPVSLVSIMLVFMTLLHLAPWQIELCEVGTSSHITPFSIAQLPSSGVENETTVDVFGFCFAFAEHNY